MNNISPKLPPAFQLSPEVGRALANSLPVLALESTVITHGLPYPQNLSLAEEMEATVRGQGVTPATIAVVAGKVRVGLSSDQLGQLASHATEMHKISTRDFAPAIAKGGSGGTTVAGTMLAASTAGIRVFATGGIGGVHHDLTRRRASFDISADLPALARIPMIVVCAGAKAILDLPATLEYLETSGVPVVGFQTDEFPAFYSRQSGLDLKTSARADSAQEVVAIARAHWALGLTSAILVVAPPPEEVALPPEQVAGAIRQALKEAEEQKIRGQGVTPFLLERVSELSGGSSLRANLGLLLNNAAIAGQIARQWARGQSALPLA